MFYGVYEAPIYDAEGKIKEYEYGGGVYTNFDDWYADTCCPDSNILAIFDFKAHGKTYAEKKASVQEAAHLFDDTNYLINMSYNEYYLLSEFFTKYGKRLGLVKEFTENGII